jgi:hypothetical protein
MRENACTKKGFSWGKQRCHCRFNVRYARRALPGGANDRRSAVERYSATNTILIIVRNTIEAVMVTCGATCSKGATDSYEVLHRSGVSSRHFKVSPIEINTYITNSQTTRPQGESMNLILPFPTKRTLRGRALLLLIIVPHNYSPLLVMLSAIAVMLTCVDVV